MCALAIRAMACPHNGSTIASPTKHYITRKRNDADSANNLSLLPLAVNDAAPVPTPSPSHGSYHWTFERLVAAGLVPLSVAPFAGGSASPVLDAALCSLLLLHTHVGFQAILIDYVPNSRYPGLRKSLTWLLNGATLLVGVGLYEYETNDIGLTQTVKRVWTA